MFFDELPPDTGLAFVVIQHLSPNFKSLMDQLLARHTKMRITRVEDEAPLQPNCVYLISPKKDLFIRKDRLIALDADASRQLRLPIDRFFVSLADTFQDKAIGIILSGTGSDGTKGATAIKDAGGYMIAQSPETAKFDGMPQSIIRQGIPDRILSPNEIPAAILDYVNHPENARTIRNLEQDHVVLTEVLDLLRTVEGVDFSSYRLSTITRRIERRLRINQVASPSAYLSLLKRSPDELRDLHNELLIGVTRFFRDTESFSELENSVIPKLVEDSNGATIRVWVAGCSTGEEAYSIGILFREYFEKVGNYCDVKIFATDLDRESINVGAKGLYPENIATDIGEDRLHKYFTKKESEYEVVSKIRRMIIFSHHNVIKDPPFTKVDLVSCRNLLIYFQPDLQLKAISLFHFGLKPNGYLFLGKSEALGTLASEFSAVSAKYKIFRKLRDIKLALATDISMSSNQQAPLRPMPVMPHREPTAALKDSRVTAIYEKLLDEFVPPCLLVDDDLQLLHVFGTAGGILNVPMGKTSFDVRKMLPKELGLALTVALGRCGQSDNEVVLEDVSVDELATRKFRVRVRQVHQAAIVHLRTYLVFFEEYVKTVGDQVEQVIEVFDVSRQSEERIGTLENELQSTKETLQATIEELETTNEELQSTNEELMSSNEELQSANEELHSVNEELYTVNSEYQKKISELTEANSDIDFLLRATRIGILFLDNKLRIRRYNPGMRILLNLMPHDVGRPVTELKLTFGQDAIFELIKSASESKTETSEEIEFNGSIYMIRALPCHRKSGELSTEGLAESADYTGVILSILDITSIKAGEELRRIGLDLSNFIRSDLAETMSKVGSYMRDQAEDGSNATNSTKVGEFVEKSLRELQGRFEALKESSRELKGPKS